MVIDISAHVRTGQAGPKVPTDVRETLRTGSAIEKEQDGSAAAKLIGRGRAGWITGRGSGFVTGRHFPLVSSELGYPYFFSVLFGRRREREHGRRRGEADNP